MSKRSLATVQLIPTFYETINIQRRIVYQVIDMKRLLRSFACGLIMSNKAYQIALSRKGKNTTIFALQIKKCASPNAE